jgi:hypothetical protein
MLRIINQANADKTYGGVLVPALSPYDIPSLNEDAFRNDVNLRFDLSTRSVEIFDGAETWTGLDALLCLDRDRKNNVVTSIEQPNKDLVLASDDQPFIGNVCTLTLFVPGQMGDLGTRQIAGGYVFSDHYGWGDRANKCLLLDKDFIYAGIFYAQTPTDAGIEGVEGLTWADVMPEGVEMGSYTDDALPEYNRGWRLWADDGGQGGADIDTIGGFGRLLSLCYLVVVLTKKDASPATNGCFNAWWAKPNL